MSRTRGGVQHDQSCASSFLCWGKGQSPAGNEPYEQHIPPLTHSPTHLHLHLHTYTHRHTHALEHGCILIRAYRYIYYSFRYDSSSHVRKVTTILRESYITYTISLDIFSSVMLCLSLARYTQYSKHIYDFHYILLTCFWRMLKIHMLSLP